jgi:uncharacterized protein with HEPN domain
VSTERVKREWKLRVQDILDSLAKIESFIKGYTLDSFSKDQKTFDAVIRNLEIVGEASHHIPLKVKQKYKAIPWRELRDFRNFLAHIYGADAKVIWDTIHDNLFPLRNELKALLIEK